MADTGIIDQLMDLGFSSQEARVFIALLSSPFATGYELALAAKLPRANVYSVLAGLVDKDAIELVSQEPARYVAHSPADVLGRIKRDTASRCDRLIADLASVAAPDTPAPFWTLRGREAVIERVGSMVGDAKSRVAVSLWAEDLEWLGAALQAAHNAGQMVVVNLFGDADVAFGDIYRHESPGQTISGHLLTLTVDLESALVASLDEPAGAVYTQHPALVRLVEKLLRDEAYLAAIYEQFKPQLEAVYGPHLLGLRQKLLPAEEARRLVSVVGFGAVNDTVEEIWSGHR